MFLGRTQEGRIFKTMDETLSPSPFSLSQSWMINDCAGYLDEMRINVECLIKCFNDSTNVLKIGLKQEDVVLGVKFPSTF